MAFRVRARRLKTFPLPPACGDLHAVSVRAKRAAFGLPLPLRISVCALLAFFPLPFPPPRFRRKTPLWGCCGLASVVLASHGRRPRCARPAPVLRSSLPRALRGFGPRFAWAATSRRVCSELASLARCPRSAPPPPSLRSGIPFPAPFLSYSPPFCLIHGRLCAPMGS